MFLKMTPLFITYLSIFLQEYVLSCTFASDILPSINLTEKPQFWLWWDEVKREVLEKKSTKLLYIQILIKCKYNLNILENIVWMCAIKNNVEGE